MSVIKDTKLCQPFNNDYGPLNVMWNGKKIAGWSNKSKGCNNTSITLTGTYKDKLDYIIHGKTKIEGGATTGTWRQLVQNPRPCTERTTGISRRGSGVLTFEDDGIRLKNDDSGKGAMRVLLPYALQEGHKYFIGLFLKGAGLEVTTYISAAFNTTGTMVFNYNKLAYVLYAGEYEDGVNTVTFTINGSNPNKESIYVNRIMVVDLTTLWSNDNLADSASYYNSDFSNMSTLIYYLEEVDPTPEATTETIIPNVESPFFSGNPTPINPCDVIPDEVWIETSDGVSTDRIARDDLHVWDELHSSGKISSYGAVKTFGEINWSDDTDDANIFYWNGASDIYKTENVFMDSYKRVETYDELHGSDYAYWVNDSNKRVYVKDKDISAVVDLKDIRGNCKIFYHKSWSDATETKVELPVTYPYTTLVKTNTDCTVTYKKWDDSETD